MPLRDLWRPRLLLAGNANLAPSMLMARIAFCLLAIWGVFGFIVIDMRRHTSADALRFGADIATLVETAIAREFEVYDLSVQALASDSTDPTILALPDALKRKALYDQSAEASNLGQLFLLDRDGRLIDSSKGRDAIGMDFSDREYFRAHQSDPNAGLAIGGPFMGRMTHTPSMAISRRRPSSDGRFIGVAVGSIQLSFFEKLFSSIHLPTDSSITLMRRDGVILTRIPFREEYIGRRATSDILAEALSHDAGTYHRISATDGMERLFAFRRIGNLPLYVTVGLSTDEIYRNWRSEMLTVGAGFAGLSVVILLLGVSLGGELARRNEAEGRLAELASTDHLTLLANRRRFDEVLESEWRRAVRVSSPLSLLMVDGDFFKSFNDTYGHLEGDRVLRSIAQALRTCVDRPADLVARYGGEEFAVLLPSTDIDGAAVVADAVRAAIDATAHAHAGSPSGRLTTSIGVACRTPDAFSSPVSLVEAADAALYIAKAEGRDRVVVEGRSARSSMPGERRVA